MSIKDRLKFIARSYINSFSEGERRSSFKGFGSDEPRSSDEPPLDEMDFEAQWAAFQREEDERARREGSSYNAPPPGSKEGRALSQCYKNLELRDGASYEEVKIAFKDLMRKYHPDKFGHDREKAEAATKVAQKVTESYQILKRHFEKGVK